MMYSEEKATHNRHFVLSLCREEEAARAYDQKAAELLRDEGRVPQYDFPDEQGSTLPPSSQGARTYREPKFNFPDEHEHVTQKKNEEARKSAEPSSQQKIGTSRYRGVYLDTKRSPDTKRGSKEKKPWRASISRAGKMITIGRYET